MADTLRETLAVRRIGRNEFQAEPFFERARAGNAAAIAFGGLALSQAISAAYHTLVDESNPAAKLRHELFSVQGSYLSPASTDVPTTFVVEDLRSTRTMMTRLVTVSQLFPQKVKPTKPAASSSSSTQEATAPPPPGVKRKVLIAILDFHAPETPFLTYSRQPLHPGPNSYPSPESLPNSNTTLPRLLSGDPKVLKVMMTQFDLPMRMFEHRPVPSSMGAQNALGFLKTKTSQDELDITKRTYTNWVRVRDNLDGPSETYAALGFIMDTALSFLPLTLTSIPLTTARAASSMDFSLRFFTPLPADKPMNETWLLHEQNTERAADGRSFSIGRMFDTAGVEIARMSQVSILRGPPDSPGASGVKESKTVSSAGPLDRAAKL